MKKFFLGFFIFYFLSRGGLVYGQFSRRERREMPASWERGARLTWTFHTVTPKGGDSFSYFNQDYNLDLRGPFFLPAFGQAKINLNYRLGKNVYEGYAWFGKTNQRLYTYSTAFYFSPVRLRRIFSLDLNFNRSTFDQFQDKNVLTNSLMRTSSVVSFTLHPPGAVNLAQLFTGRNNKKQTRKRNNFLYFNFPIFNYTYSKHNTEDIFSQQPKFNQERIDERYGVRWSFQRLRTRYEIKTSQNVNLVTQKTYNVSRLRDFYASLHSYENLKIFQSMVFDANHQVSETFQPGSRSSSKGNLSTTLTSNPVTFLGIYSTAYYRNYFSFVEEIKNWRMTNNLSLNSASSLTKGIRVNNYLDYGFSSDSVGSSAAGQLKERISLYAGYSPFSGLAMSTYPEWSYFLSSSGKGLNEKYNARVDFSPWGIFNTFFECWITRAKDLNKKEVSAHEQRGVFGFSGAISPLALILNGNGNGNSNGNRGNGNNKHNGFLSSFFNNGSLLRLGYNLYAEQIRNLLTRINTTAINENYQLRSMLFNGFLNLELQYNRMWRKTDGQPISRQEYFLTNISSQAGFFYRGLVLNCSIYTPNFQQFNIQVNADYNLGQSSLSLVYRIQQITSPHTALSMIFKRRI